MEVTAEAVFTTEVDVSIDDVVNEWFRLLDEEDQGGVRRTIVPMLGSVTKLLSLISDESISGLVPSAREEVRRRLEVELARYQER